MGAPKEQPKFDAWNPGLESEFPDELLPLVTLFGPQNSELDYAQAREISEFCGLEATELILLRADRLVKHELLIRVTADLSVPDGPNYEELGINLRAMVGTIFERYVQPRMDVVDDALTKLRQEAEQFIDRQLSDNIFDRSTKEARNPGKVPFFGRLFGAKPSGKKVAASSQLPEVEALQYWQQQLATHKSPFEDACLESLLKIVGGFVGHRGRLYGEKQFIVRLVVNNFSNDFGSEKIGEAIEPMMKRAIVGENYRVLPPQEKPVIMNVKGASAAGKSTIRPQMRRFAEELGIAWEDFALISPDYWRKYLLDYNSLGEHYKYAAMLTGQELEIIDKKLDRYMAHKASRQMMSHLLIDRFRFDSFTPNSERGSDSKLLTRFGDRIFMFFMVTPPAETVERAWQRGIQTGRYKAVDDLLYHNVEAYTGMPELFFSWALSADKHVHYEFLDNDVPKGELPRTVAFGWNNSMTILDIKAMIDIERYRKVNIEARGRDQIFAAENMIIEDNVGYLRRCADQISTINFADQSNAYVYARLSCGKLIWCDRHYIETQSANSGVKRALAALGYRSQETASKKPDMAAAIDIAHEKKFTLGRWNEN